MCISSNAVLSISEVPSYHYRRRECNEDCFRLSSHLGALLCKPCIFSKRFLSLSDVSRCCHECHVELHCDNLEIWKTVDFLLHKLALGGFSEPLAASYLDIVCCPFHVSSCHYRRYSKDTNNRSNLTFFGVEIQRALIYSLHCLLTPFPSGFWLLLQAV